jgi:hypothetical protein
VGLAIGANQLSGAVEHGGGVVEIGAIALRVRKNHSHLELARGGKQRLRHRAGEFQEMLLVILNEPVGKEWRKEHLGKADDVDALARSLVQHRAGGLDCLIHTIENRTRLRRRNRELSCHLSRPPVSHAQPPAMGYRPR